MLINSVFIRICTGQVNRFNDNILTNIEDIINENIESFMLVDIDLYYELEKRKTGSRYRKRSKEKKMLLTLYKYFSRMLIRPVPFGFFSYVGIIKASDQFLFKKILEGEKKIEINNDILWKYFHLNKDVFLFGRLKANDTTFVHGEFIKFYVHNEVTGKLELRTINFDEGIMMLLSWLQKKQYKNYKEIYDYLISEFDIVKLEAESLLSTLFSQGLLISGHFPFILNESSYLERLIAYCGSSEQTKILKENLVSIQKSLKSIKSGMENNFIIECENIIRILKKGGINDTKIFKGQTNLNTKHLTVPKRPLECLEENIEEILSFSEIEQYNFSSFINKMESIIKTPAKLVDVLEIFKDAPVEVVRQSDENIINLIKEKIEQNIVQDEILLENIKIDRDFNKKISKNITIQYKVLESNGVLLHQINNYPIEKYLNRYFEYNKEVKEYVENFSIESDVLTLEVDILPHVRTFNIVNETDNKCSFFYKQNEEKISIDISDIYVTTYMDRVLLFSLIHQKQIIPKFTNILFPPLFQNDLLLKFLHEIHLQNESKLSIISWKNILNSNLIERNKCYFPRIRYKDIIISPKTWRFTDMEVYKNFITNNHLPEIFLLIDKFGDPILLKKELSLSEEIVQKEIEKGEIIIQEYIPGTNEIQYEHELIAQIKRKDSSDINFNDFILSEINSITQPSDFLSNNLLQWLYIKVYCDEHNCDEIIMDVIEIANRSLSSLKIKKYFFLRYNDGKNHIRFRFLIEDLINRNSLFELLIDSLNSKFKNLTITKDVYRDERRRYFYHSIETVEDIFYLDSKFSSELLYQKTRTEFFSILAYSVESYLDDLGLLDISVINDFIEIFRCFFPNIYAKNHIFKSEINIIDNNLELLINKRSIEFKRHWNTVNYTERKLYIKYVWNYIHMHCNRLSNSPLNDEIKVYLSLKEKFQSQT
ncbi:MULTISPECIES: thiopeptide-type bacteriocin biosynthesis protein [Sphingobacterium]|uniref:thiopeptide-type bacteriocin biosynthesis protein n=1 Tax=Sphingobacterium TaxID=28453 RepID=UPI0008A11269|nr:MULTISPECIES: thiopeptide-type bacteriocin biosynthesis protein [Sphingobacterium]OFV10469.1 hypothetical protein HMPREF3127_21355 [Sphingobacterium sp. HMSC13C05]